MGERLHHRRNVKQIFVAVQNGQKVVKYGVLVLPEVLLNAALRGGHLHDWQEPL